MVNSRILIAGDIMLDSYHFGKVERISPEAPVPVFLEIGHEKMAPGGAANVAVNIAAIGVETLLCSAIGEDENGFKLMELLKDGGVLTDCVVTDRERITTTKLRYMGPNNQQIMRVDTEKTDELTDELIDNLFCRLEDSISKCGLILLSDYVKGFLSEKVTQRFIKYGKLFNIPVVIDVKEKNIEKYKGATILKPNRKELSVITGLRTDTKDEVVIAASRLCFEADAQYVLTTLGAEGMILVNKDGLIEEVQSTTREVYDVTGAGDTSIAYLAAELLKGTDIIDAVKVANYAAGIQVSKVGTSIVYPDEVAEVMREYGDGFERKILGLENCSGITVVQKKQKNGKKIVFTNGCFDILHIGHVSYLQKAKQLGDVLVVGVNSDDSVKRLKGVSRPVNCLKDRMDMLAALDFVDYVIPFEDDTPIKLINEVRPDVLVKGGDYLPENIVGAKGVIANGGVVKVIPFVEGHSTSGIIEKIQKG